MSRTLIGLLLAAVFGAGSAPAQRLEPRTLRGAVDAHRAIVMRPGSSLQHYREIPADSLARTELACGNSANSAKLCRLRDPAPRIHFSAQRFAPAWETTDLDSVVVSELRIENRPSTRTDTTERMNVSVARWVYYYRNGHWVKGALIESTVD